MRRRAAAAEHRGAHVHARSRQTDHRRRAARPHRAGASDHDGAEDRRDHPRRRHVAELLHRHPLGQQRAAHGGGHPEGRQPVHRHARFEEDRTREQLAGGPVEHTDVAIWQEDESPFERVAHGLKERGIATGRLGIEETSNFVFADSIASAAPAMNIASATPVIAGCRMIKDAHEIELMRIACEATLTCYEAVFKALQPGMTQNDVSGLVGAGYSKLGFPGFASVQVGEYTALPHGSITPQTIREGTIIMIDDGCTVEGYQSDITRTFVLGKATDKMKKVFDIVHQAQAAALKAAKPGAPLESIDAAARKVIVDAGYGPGFKYFTHRLGHGMGMDGHEWPYLVKNNMYRLGARADDAAGDGVQRRAGDLHQGRVRRAARGRHARHGERRGAVDAAEPVDRGALRRVGIAGSAA